MPFADPQKRREWRRAYRARNREQILAADRARKHRYGRDCLDCGKRTNGSDGRDKAPDYCDACSRKYRRIWTSDAIIAAIQLFVIRYGTLPSASDWNPAQARNNGRDDWVERFYADGDYPQTNVVQRVFGSWNAGIEAAGYEPRAVGVRGPNRPRS